MQGNRSYIKNKQTFRPAYLYNQTLFQNKCISKFFLLKTPILAPGGGGSGTRLYSQHSGGPGRRSSVFKDTKTEQRNTVQSWARGSYTVSLHCMCVQSSARASMENCLALRFSKRYNEPAKKHLVCTNSLLSSVQAFIMSVTLLLQNPLV